MLLIGIMIRLWRLVQISTDNCVHIQLWFSPLTNWWSNASGDLINAVAQLLYRQIYLSINCCLPPKYCNVPCGYGCRLKFVGTWLLSSFSSKWVTNKQWGQWGSGAGCYRKVYNEWLCSDALTRRLSSGWRSRCHPKVFLQDHVHGLMFLFRFSWSAPGISFLRSETLIR